jgi:hypothetical protein
VRFDTLRVLDVALCGFRLAVLVSRVPRRPLLSVTVERYARRHFLFWRHEWETGL